MGSWVKCKCNRLVHKNLFCGTGISLIVTEEFLDADRPEGSSSDLVSEIIMSSERLLKCKNCGRLIVLKEDKDSCEVMFFRPEQPE
jgi:hypothetical protein